MKWSSNLTSIFFFCGRFYLNRNIQKVGRKARKWLSDSELRGRLEADFRSSQKHSMSQPKLGENWPSKEGCNQKRNVILWYCLQNWRLWQPVRDSWSSIVSNPFVNVWLIYLVLLAGVVYENSTVQQNILNYDNICQHVVGTFLFELM